jgi:hypothetical protein
MADSEPTITVKLSDFDRLRDQLREAQSKNYELEKQLATARITDASGVGQVLFDGFHACIKIVQFAVGNLDPQAVVWPTPVYKALGEVADAIEKIPGVDRHVSELPSELRYTAQLAAGYTEYRRERDKNRVVVPATAADFGPQTPEAAAVHTAYVTTVNAMTPPDEKPIVPHDGSTP